jgi:hypothetical protein
MTLVRMTLLEPTWMPESSLHVHSCGKVGIRDIDERQRYILVGIE